MFVAWCASEAPRMVLRKLWLFNNAIGDDGAVAVASLMHSGLSEVHLRCADMESGSLQPLGHLLR